MNIYSVMKLKISSKTKKSYSIWPRCMAGEDTLQLIQQISRVRSRFGTHDSILERIQKAENVSSSPPAAVVNIVR